MKNGEFHLATTKYIKKTPVSYRKSKGQYFTPKSVIEKLLKKLPNKKINLKVLDPSCGTGEFLFHANKYFKKPQLYGWDIEDKLIKIARGLVPNAKLKITDALEEKYGKKFDFIIGNPPYFEFKPNKDIRMKFGDLINGRANIFSLFIKLGISLLKDGGYLAFVVPPSMNNGAYFYKLRNFIVGNTNIEHLGILDDKNLFHKALQTTMILVLKKSKNKGNHLFKKNGILIFTEKPEWLKKAFKNKSTLYDLGYKVKTGRLVWNQNKRLLTNKKQEGVPLLWAHNITEKGLELIAKKNKYQYAKVNNYDIGPAIVVNRITGTVKRGQLKAAIVPKGMKFIAENHVNVIFPPLKNKQLSLTISALSKEKISLRSVMDQLRSKEGLKVLKYITGNTQISKNELEKLFPFKASPQ